MKRLALLLALVALALPAASPAAFCSPLTCAPSQFVLGHGLVLAARGNPYQPLRVIDLRTGVTRFRLPAGVVANGTLIAKSDTLLTWFDIVSGKRLGDAPLQLHGTFSLAGASQDGSQAVLSRTQTRSTTFAIVSPGNRQDVVKLGGDNWAFDALSGSHLILVQTLKRGYEVRLYDLATNTLDPKPLKDPHESALISGIAFARLASPDGRYLFTLYVEGNGGAMIHELDVRNAEAHCIDLPGHGATNAAITYAIALSSDGRTLWAMSPGYGRIAAIDVAAHRLHAVSTFEKGEWTSNAGIAALAADGKRMAVSDGQHEWIADLAQRRVKQLPGHATLALAFSADGRRLFGIGERSRLFSLRVNR